MAKPSGMRGMKKGGASRKQRGRNSITGADPFSPSKPNFPQDLRREATRPISAGAGKQRGDRRDTSRTYTTTVKHKSRGTNPRADVKTRKR